MWFWVMAQVKEGVESDAIAGKRRQWILQGKEQEVRKRCRTAQRYVVEGSVPMQVFWLLDTDDPSVAQLITEHFGALWTIDAHVVVPQLIAEAVAAKKA